jgi:hypothetical protein
MAVAGKNGSLSTELPRLHLNEPKVWHWYHPESKRGVPRRMVPWLSGSFNLPVQQNTS